MAGSDRAVYAHDAARRRDARADPVRLEIVRLLTDGRPRACGELSTALDLPLSPDSYHLRLLRQAGVTRTRADGTLRHISLRRGDLEERFPGLLGVLTR